MKKWYLPIGVVLLLSACGGEETPELQEESQTEVSAPEGDELDPTDPEEVQNAEATTVSDLAAGNIEEGAAVEISGTVEELADDVAFPSFILVNDGQQVYIRNMAETPVEPGDTILLEGIYDGNAEEDMPLISASVITVE
ncbi:hypothetical protein [Planococcus halotolerans]|uniref:Uncharacterized protein n=1 Tax=Planococcus halotolerans TaxID=2233542 RepID=A0A365L6K0_9BACL|nr:hypothetical protein [Planococcus halotolerans]QHJ70261.1 hypothetical protein DNR44_006445 [Planococcus halotolerans]RAZ81009.1 hypothetical protein DP120_01610 [Planococcus halotolerans]